MLNSFARTPPSLLRRQKSRPHLLQMQMDMWVQMWVRIMELQMQLQMQMQMSVEMQMQMSVQMQVRVQMQHQWRMIPRMQSSLSCLDRTGSRQPHLHRCVLPHSLRQRRAAHSNPNVQQAGMAGQQAKSPTTTSCCARRSGS